MKINWQRSAILSATTWLAIVTVQGAPAVPADINALGPQNSQLAGHVGVWDVVETDWAAPGAAPKSKRGVAERKMVGPFLQETLRPSLGSPTVWRMDYLSFNRVEGRWKYVSMDTRVAAGLMPASSFGLGQSGRIDVTFEPFSSPDSGQLLQMNQVFVLQDANRDRKEQRFLVANGQGTAKMWLRHQYAYTRRLGRAK